MISIKEYAYVLCEQQEVEGIPFITSVPINNSRHLLEMINKCFQRFSIKSDAVYIAHSIPFAKGNQMEVDIPDDIPLRWLSGTPCAITHMALKIATSQIRTGKYNRVLVIGADKSYSDRERRFFGTIMGDAVVGMMVESGYGLHEIVGSRLDTLLIAPEGENTDAALIQKYRDTLPLLMRNAYKECLSENGYDSIDYIAPHTPNRGIWDVFAKMTGINRNLILDENIFQTGHLNSNDSFYHYFTHCEDETIQPGKSTMLINTGFGGTRGCTILRRNY
jgi:3-oxoacyl-[acyl-carrier-protein] synthase III